MSEKLVSVYINAFNAEPFIAETVNSILNQTYKNLKVVVIDDKSTDNTVKVLQSIKDERLSYYSLPENSHISVALNEGLKYMDGEYVAHCDSDDVWESDKLQKQIDFLENNKEYGACFTHVNIIDDKGNFAPELFPADEIYNIENRSQSEMLNFLFNKRNHFHHSAFVARKEVIDKVGLYDLCMPTLHDYDYWLRVLLICSVYIFPEKLIRVRMHPENNSKMDDGKWNSHDSEMIRAVSKAMKLCSDELFLEAFKDNLKFSGIHSHEEVIIEKAFILENIPTPLHYNPVMAIDAFTEILNNPALFEIAKNKFDFTPKKLFAMEKVRQYHNPTEEKLKDDAIASKNSLISTQMQQIHNQADQITVLNGEINSLRNHCSAITEQLNRAGAQIAEFQNSFFWRLTKPMRIVTQKIKDTAAKNTAVLNFLIVTKCLLRSGVAAAKEKYKTLHFVPKTDYFVPQEISDEQRNFEENYSFKTNTKFSILVPLYNTPKNFLKEMIDSVINQTYKNWELCLADGSTDDFAFVGKYCKDFAKKDSRIIYKKLEENKGISENTNACIDMASGDYIALFDHDDILHPSALFEYAKTIEEQNADFIYCDEDKFDELGGKFYDAHFKPDFAIDNLRANNYICHFTVFKKDLLLTAGRFRKEFDGSQDHDLVLRLTEKAQKVVHIPKILYRWRVSKASVASDPYAKPYTITAGINAVSEHLQRVGLKGTVESSPFHPNIYRIRYDIIGQPLVSILIPNYNHIDELDRCIKSILEKSTYSNYEIVIIENNSNEETFEYYKTLEKYPNIRVVVYKPVPNEFNYSKINNFGFKYTKGEHIILLNNDVEIISPDWIEEMLMFSQREDIGAVGAKLYYPDDTIQHAGIILGVLTLAGHSFKHSSRENPGYFGRAIFQQNVTAVTAACMMIRRNVFEEVNGLDETFKVAFNDIDLCMRIRQKGYLLAFTPYCELYHYESISRGDDSSPEKIERFVSEVTRFQARYRKELDAGDPYYNPNLTLDREDFSVK